MKNLGTREINDNEITLRKFKLEDSQDMFDNYCNNSEVTKYLTWKPHENIEVTKELLRGWISQYNDTTYQWAITIGGRVVGSAGLVSVDTNEEKGVLGYCLAKKYWNRGIMTRVLGLIIDYCFNEVGFKRLEAVYHADNKSSGKVMLKNKMNFDQVIKKVHKDNTGRYVDVNSYYIEKE